MGQDKILSTRQPRVSMMTELRPRIKKISSRCPMADLAQAVVVAGPRGRGPRWSQLSFVVNVRVIAAHDYS